MTEPRRIFLDVVAEPWRSALADEPGLDAWLDGCLTKARDAWPELPPPDLGFVRLLASKMHVLPSADAYAKLRASELFLTHACVAGDERALALFEERYLSRVGPTLAGMRLAPAVAADIQASVRELLFFGKDGGRPLVADYSGRGDLAGWLRSIVVRLALKAKSRDRLHVEVEEGLGDAAAAVNPELDYLRERFSADFGAALARALETLSTRERNLLRQHYLDGLTLDAITNLYRVHRATAARWLSAAREAVLASVRRDLAARMSPSEVNSLLNATKRELPTRISSLLRGS